MNILQRIFYWFTPYVNEQERSVARMFSRVHEATPEHVISGALVAAMQRDVAALSLWSEHAYKGYDYLTKSMRRQLYENLNKIRDGFKEYAAAHPVSQDALLGQVSSFSGATVLARSRPEKLAFLVSIMQYLHPGRGVYEYRESSSFGRLLEDPSKHRLEGDCNQIVTLYLYLYATKYDVTDLRIAAYPGHVALRFHELDIETTTGEFTQYSRDDLSVLPVQEIVSTSLLDTSDSYFRTHKVAAETFLEAARMAYLTSSDRKIAQGNLKAAYHNAVGELVEQRRYPLALKYAEQSHADDLIEIVGHNGAVYYMGRHEYDTARKFAAYTKEPSALHKTIHHNEGAHYFGLKKYHEAITAFRRAGEESMVKQCYVGLFMKEQDVLKNVSTVDDLKAHAATVHRMREYAEKSGDVKLIQHASKLQKSLS